MTARLRLVAQAGALALVAALLGLLVWKLVDEERGNVSVELANGNTPDAPGFTLRRLDRPGELSFPLAGKAVVVNFWASWCEPCAEEARALDEVWRKYRSRGLVVLGVDARDFDGDARRFARKYGMSYPIVHDGPGKLLEPYGVTGFPETFFVDRRGKVVGKMSGQVNANAETEGEFDELVRKALS